MYDTLSDARPHGEFPRSAGVTLKVNHYHWAGLDFMIEDGGAIVFLEANRSSHMLAEFLQLYGHGEPFAKIADVIDAAGTPACLLWRRSEPDVDELDGAPWIGRELSRRLRQKPLIAYVEDNQEPRPELLTSDNQWVRPASIFRWWYPLPWSHERSGCLVVNPNAAWMAVRDKYMSYSHLKRAKHFRVPISFPVNTLDDVKRAIDEQRDVFKKGFVLKPRVGFGGQGVQIGELNDLPQTFSAPSLLSERIRPALRDGRFWDIRVFVMGGTYFGGIMRLNADPVTNIFRGASASAIDSALSSKLEAAALEAVRLIDNAAEDIHRRPPVPSPLLRVTW